MWHGLENIPKVAHQGGEVDCLKVFFIPGNSDLRDGINFPDYYLMNKGSEKQLLLPQCRFIVLVYLKGINQRQKCRQHVHLNQWGQIPL